MATAAAQRLGSLSSLDQAAEMWLVAAWFFIEHRVSFSKQVVILLLVLLSDFRSLFIIYFLFYSF